MKRKSQTVRDQSSEILHNAAPERSAVTRSSEGPGATPSSFHSAFRRLHETAGNRASGEWMQQRFRPQVPAGTDHTPARDCPASAPGALEGFLESDHGQPLPGSITGSAESTFGRSFEGVRVHLGSEASRLAKGVEARAFTYGNDLVFRAGQYSPDTPAGRQLLMHELGHVAAGDSPNDEVFRALFYDTSAIKIPTPPRGLTAKSMHAEVDKMIAKTPPDIASANVKGTPSGSEAEIFLLHIIFQLGRRDRWDSFVRLETEIGWPPVNPQDAGTVIPFGLVNLTIDDKGNATAELAQAGMPPPTTVGKTGAGAIQQLQKDFQVHSVAKGDKDWEEKGFEHDLGDVLDAFQLLPSMNKKALKGVDLLRFASLPKNHSGEFATGGGVVTGATQITAPPTLKLADKAFVGVRSGTPPSFFENQRVEGGFTHQSPGSFETILHETGHAVEEQVYRPALEAVDLAIIQQNRSAARVNATIAKAKAAASSGDPAAASLSATAAAQRKTYDAAVALVAKDRKALKATQVSDKVIKPLLTAANTKGRDAHSAVQAASAAAKSFTPQEVGESATYRAAIDSTTAALADYAKKSENGPLEDLDDALLAGVTARNTRRDELSKVNSANPALATFSPVETAQNTWEDALRTLAHTRGRTLRLDRFVSVVNAAGILPFTKYARENWPYKPQEFYAEAYSLWLTDPEFVKTQYRPVFDFFDSGDYEK